LRRLQERTQRARTFTTTRSSIRSRKRAEKTRTIFRKGTGDGPEVKKADHRAVIKLAGDALAKRSKDLRLAGWLVEAQLRIEGFSVLAPSIELLRALQETFWPTLYPLIEEGGDLELRMLSVEDRGRLIAAAVRKVPLTRSGLSLESYLESRRRL
jgi:type VI secretion system protein ImpA